MSRAKSKSQAHETVWREQRLMTDQYGRDLLLSGKI
jgi:hypothetical protein